MHFVLIVHDINQYMVQMIYHNYGLDKDSSSSCTGKSQPKNTHTYKSQHETMLADLNQYMAKTL